MRKCIALTATIMFAAMDIISSTILYCRGNQFSRFHYLPMYHFTQSVFELWCISILRASVLLGLCVGVIRVPIISIPRLKSCRSLFYYIAAALGMFTLIKLLAVSENETVQRDAWFWGLFAWSLTGSVVFALLVTFLGNITVIQSDRLTSLRINEDGSESRPLLGENPSEENKELKTPGEKISRGTVWRLILFAKPDWPLYLLGFIFLTISATGEIFIPFYTGKVVDGIVIDKSQSEFTGAIVKMALISMGSAIAAGIRGGCLKLVNQKVNIRIRNTLFAAILHQEVAFFDTNQTGNITSRLTSDTTTMSDAIGLNLNIFLRNLIKAIGVVFFMLKLSWRLTVVTMIGVPCIMVVSEIYGKYYKKLAELVQDSLASANNVAEEACSSMRTVRSFANEDGEIARYREKLQLTYVLNKKQSMLYAGFVWSSMMFNPLPNNATSDLDGACVG